MEESEVQKLRRELGIIEVKIKDLLKKKEKLSKKIKIHNNSEYARTQARLPV